MKIKKLKMLLVMVTAVLGIGLINYTGNYTTKQVYADEVQSDTHNINVDISYEAEDAKDSINPIIIITNTDSQSLDFKNLNLKYYYPSDLYSEEIYNCYYAGTNDGENKNFTNYVEGNIKKDSSTDKVYADITFTDGTLDAGQSMIIKGGIHKSSWSFYDVSDKSLCSLEAYIDSVLVYGQNKEVVLPTLDKDIISYGLNMQVKINLNGNKFLGIKGLTNGYDYTFDGNILRINSSAISRLNPMYNNDYKFDTDLYLIFDNNIHKVLTMIQSKYAYIPEHYMCRIGGGDFKAGEIALIPVNIFFNTQPDMQCEEPYYLYYDSDCFEVLGMYTNFEAVKYEDDSDSGIIHVDSREYLSTQRGMMNLLLKVKDDAPIGNTKINFIPDKQSRVVTTYRSIINITK